MTRCEKRAAIKELEVSRYRSYPEYRPSGVEWLGQIPSGWDLIRIGHLFKRIKQTGFEDRELLSVYRDYGVVPKHSRDDNNNRPSEDLSPYQLVEPKDLVINKMKAWQGSVAMSDFEGIVSPAYFVYKPVGNLGEDYDSKFMHYLLRCPVYISQYLRHSKGIRVNQWDLDPDSFKAMEVLLPKFEEQRTIAAFLDYETARIDSLIDKQQQLIELLKEKRQAVISLAVTKGLNPDAPMKDSGVEWLGQVPEHWVVAKLGYRYEVLLGKMLDAKRISGAHLGHYLRNTDVQWGKINTLGLPQMDFRPDEAARYSVNRGDLLVCEGGEIGRAAVWQHDEPCFYQKALHRLRPYNSKTDLTGYFFYILFDAATQGRFDGGAGKATIAHLPAETFRQYRFAFPPYEEQIELEEHLREITEKYDRIESQGLKQISLLQERRTALISAAVTGKIDLRGWNQPEAKQ
ncbi:restriction endonuclease subunit S [Shewanella algae]|nr:restriction endonuclease subunit S [Shewanella algae]